MTDSKIIITGGAGFIGSNLVRLILETTNHRVINIDKLSYPGGHASIADLIAHPRHDFECEDICDESRMRELLAHYQPDAIMHLAAESHVDRSIDSPGEFIRTNVVGTYTLLEASLSYWSELDAPTKDAFRFQHISTDEVYGTLGFDDAPFEETTAYAPSSPYAASKAAADHLVNAWYRTYGFPSVITNCTNNYGPYQFPEKLIPLVITKAVSGELIPIYGKGENVRDWIHVRDHAAALYAVLCNGLPGENYNISADAERSNIDIVTTICQLLDDLRPNDPVVPHAKLITYVTDRPGHDLRYAMKHDKITAELGWQPSVSFEQGLAETVLWYLDNDEWRAAVTSGNDEGQRLGQRGSSSPPDSR